MDFQQYIRTELLILIPVMYIIGMGLKRSKVADKHIPLILGTVSVILSALWVFATANLESGKGNSCCVFYGCNAGNFGRAGASVYASQLYIQANKDK